MFSPLDGVRVIDLTHVLAGPYCTQLLAMFGAEVIKIEPPGVGDMTRPGGPIPELNKAGLGLAFCTQNTDKESMTVDLKSSEGIDIVRRLVAEADVFVENFRPGVVERLGLGFDELVSVNSNLVYVSLTAYGQDGPIGHRPAYDHVVQAMSGVMEVTGTEETGPEETGPVKVGAPIVDYASGQKGAMATLAAIMEQRRSGQPQRVDSAMLDSALLLMANTLTATANTGRRPQKLGNQAASGTPSSGCFETGDGLLAIAANTERQFTDLCRAIGRPDLIDDQRFNTGDGRRRHQDEFRTILQAVLATRDAATWEEEMDRNGVPASRVRSMEQMLAEGQPAARELLVDIEVDGRTVQLPTGGFKVNGETPGPRRPPPVLGADTRPILSRIGYTSDEIDRLAERGVI